ncbi:GNAT family N-acetyltransferase [Kitasatospora sp. NPDC002040]|uniref:GNAT family N-acetyltransferase n=1 Tax=Kitasatospora sp. NPDC002040 TaxID=3154661 RepID=UPI0033209B8E
MEIRTGGPADTPAVLALLDGAVAWLAAEGRTGQWGEQPWSDRPTSVAGLERSATEDLVRLAVDAGGRVVGAAVLAGTAPSYAAPVDGPELYLRWLVTDRAARGTGVGAALVADALAEARRRGVPLLRVDCYAGDDRRLVAQYERLGFTRTQAFELAKDDGRRWPGQLLEIRL